jgi:hypothetical protein
MGNLFIFISKKVRKMAKKSPKSLLPTKDVHCLIKQEKKFVPYKISPPFFFMGFNDPTPTGAQATNLVLGFKVDKLFSWGN